MFYNVEHFNKKFPMTNHAKKQPIDKDFSKHLSGVGVSVTMDSQDPNRLNVTRDDLERYDVLMDPQNGIFGSLTLPDETLETICSCADIASVEVGGLIMTQSEDIKYVPLQIVLEGKFEVIHVTNKIDEKTGEERFSSLVVAIDHPGNCCGDVEMLVPSLNLARYKNEFPQFRERCQRTGNDGRKAWAYIRCIEPAKVLRIPRDCFPKINDFKLIFRLAQLLAIKLLLRNAVSDLTTLDVKPEATPKERVRLFFLQKVTSGGIVTNSVTKKHIVPFSRKELYRMTETKSANFCSFFKETHVEGKATSLGLFKKMGVRYEGTRDDCKLIFEGDKFLDWLHARGIDNN